MNKTEIGALLRAVRRRAGKTQADMARLLPASQTTVSDWETGTNEPPLAMIYAWAAACDVRARLVIGKDDRTPDTDVLVEAWQDLPENERDTYLQIIQARAAKARKTT